ncbi:MAG: protein kinase [Deltaproteobacteria bacterium]|nr:protein kinase [Deltaproteobacteria bacterium]
MIGEKAAKGLRPFAPQSFGRYTLLAPLASGGMGEVYLGRLEGVEGFEKLVVIKKILPQLAHDDDFRGRFVSEARVLVKLHHGSVAQVLDMGEREGELYIALEFVDGKDLRKVAARCKERGHTVPLGLTLFVMMRVLDALAYAHRKKDEADQDLNLVHRDVSPQNVLISYEGEVKVIDFGLAKSSLSLGRTSPSVVLGKFFYMSPEQAKHQKVDRRSDLYAAGICLYELIAGKNPFESVPQGELMAKVANPQIEPLGQAMPGVPPAVEQLVMRALAPDPKDRFASAEEMRGRLMAAMLELDPGAGPESLAHFMRAVFTGEHAQERKIFAQLREAGREARPDARTGLMPVLQIADAKPPDARANTVVAEVVAPPKPMTPATAETHVGPVPESNRETLAAMPALSVPEPSQTDVFQLPGGREAEATRPAETGEMPVLSQSAADTGEMRALPGADLDSGPTEGAFEFQMPEDSGGHRTTDPARAPLEPGRRPIVQAEPAPRLSPPAGALPGLIHATAPIAALDTREDPQEFQLPGHEEPKLEPSQPIIQAAMVEDEPPRSAPPVLAPPSNVPGPPVLSASPTPRAAQAPRSPSSAAVPRPAPVAPKSEAPGLPKVVIAAELSTDPPKAPPGRRPNTSPAPSSRRPPSPSSPGTPQHAPPVLSGQPTQRVTGGPVQIAPTQARTAPSNVPSRRNSLLVGLAIGAGLVLVVVIGLLAWSFSHPG